MKRIKKQKTVVVYEDVYSAHVELTKREACLLFALLSKSSNAAANWIGTKDAVPNYELWEKFFYRSVIDSSIAYEELGVDRP